MSKQTEQAPSPDIIVVESNQVKRVFGDALARNETAILKGTSREDPVLEFAHSTALGLSLCPRRLECRYLYDARGSMLFDLITEQPEYYLTRTEMEILAANACRIREITGPATLVEFGSGSSTKTDYLLRAWLSCDPKVRYIPVDISESALRKACQLVRSVHSGAQVVGVNGDYHEAFSIVREASPAMVLFLGSTIGNFHPEEESCFLAEMASSLSPGDFFLIGVDLVKERAVIEPAYNDAAGVTADFTRNLFARMNRELKSNVDLSNVEHVATYNSLKEQVDISARFNREQTISVAPLGEGFTIADGEMIQTEVSRKFHIGEYVPYLKQFGFKTEEVFTDERNWFALILLRRMNLPSKASEGGTT